MKASLINACSIKNKSSTLYDLIVDKSLDLLFITETWLSEYDTSAIAAFLPETHNFFHCPRKEGRGGGVGVAVSKRLKSVKSNCLSFDSCECLQLTVTHENRKVTCNLVYRPPQSNISQFLEDFEVLVMNSETSGESNIYLGDYNIWMDKHFDTRTMEFGRVLESYSLENLIETPTHRLGHTIDLIIVRSGSSLVTNLEVEPQNTISDHKNISFQIKSCIYPQKK